MAEETTKALEALRGEIYDLTQEIGALEQQLVPPALPEEQLLEQLAKYRAELAAKERALAEAEARARAESQRALTRDGNFSVAVKLHMTPVPTGFYHLFERESRPLVVCTVTDLVRDEARLTVAAWLEGYSAQDVQTVELGYGDNVQSVKLLPTLFPERVHALSELTRATLHVVVTDLGEGRVMLHRTEAVWLLARNSAPRTLTDPATGQTIDVTPYLGAFVTPHAPDVLEFLHKAAALHPEGRLEGSHGNPGLQAQAIYEALKEAGIRYVTTVLDINPDPNAKSQRVRLPRESLREKVANCVDGAVLFASLFEAISLNPALVAVPGHMLVAWEDRPGNGAWRYLEMTELDNADFASAVKYGSRLAAAFEKHAHSGNPELFRRWPVRNLRTQFNIWPME